ncbi:methyltransferase family protein [Donghicola mangrovi]|uniref:methyltransferase family protein n=1 Tax=Donghicola mangrovi TaxID=2729614 RepID=UPI0015A451F9|nr:isoprenylcysteine carboxylmethyltransferase family protein [Donghicola mangrovi]
MRRFVQIIDIPPVWLVLAILAARVIGQKEPMWLSFGGQWAQLMAGVLIGGGLILMVLAVYEMRRQRTTLMPHQEADHLVTSGIFSRSRNPIYLGDLLVLAGFVLRFDAVFALTLLPVFVWVIERRFVIPEEDRLRRKFRADFARYCHKTRRWI